MGSQKARGPAVDVFQASGVTTGTSLAKLPYASTVLFLESNHFDLISSSTPTN
jgi:hypothetical protein